MGSVMVAWTGPLVGLVEDTVQSMVSPVAAVVVLPVLATTPVLPSGDGSAAAGRAAGPINNVVVVAAVAIANKAAASRPLSGRLGGRQPATGCGTSRWW